MKPFIGFSTDRTKTIRVPEGFFEAILPQITSMLEMKVTLYLFWRLSRGAVVANGGTGVNGNGANGAGHANGSDKGSEPSPRMVSLAEMEASGELRASLSGSKGPRSLGEALREGLELCVSRGTLLQLLVREEVDDGKGWTGEERWYMLNTKEHRAWVGALAKGEIDVAATPLVSERMEQSLPVRVIVERPSIYALYEQNIGLLTPILAEQLQEAERRYPYEWIEVAFGEAVLNNKRSWRYIERILERWALEGKQGGKAGGPDGRAIDPDKYTKGKYAFLFRPE